MDNGTMTYNHNGIIFRYNEDEILSFVAKWIELDNVKWNSQTQGDKHHFFSLCGNNKSHSKVVVSLLGPESMVGERERKGKKNGCIWFICTTCMYESITLDPVSLQNYYMLI